jgi:hypothetical protein
MREDTINPEFPVNKTAEVWDDTSTLTSETSQKPAETASTLPQQSGASDAGAARDRWEQEKDKLILALTERILRGRDYIAFSELRRLEVPELVLAALRQHAHKLIREEKPLVLQSRRRFELDDAEMRSQLRRLRNMLAERLIFDRNELHNAIAFGVRLQFDLITQPRATLERLIYDGVSERNREDIAIILQGLGEIALVQAVQRLSEDLSDELVTKDAFAALCRRAEKEVYGAHPGTAFLADLQAYHKFCANVGPSREHRLDRYSVLKMLEARGWNDLAENLSPDLASKVWWSLAEMERLLGHRISPSELPSPPPAAEKTLVSPEVAVGPILQETTTEHETEEIAAVDLKPPSREQESLAVETSLAPAESAAAEVESQIEEQRLPATGTWQEVVGAAAGHQAEETVVEKRPKVFYHDPDGEDQVVITRAKIEAQPPGPYPSMTLLVDEKSRRAFIKKIFHKDPDTYLAFIEQLEAAQTWKEAKVLLDSEFQARRINPYSREAVQLSDLVFSRYFTKGTK